MSAGMLPGEAPFRDDQGGSAMWHWLREGSNRTRCGRRLTDPVQAARIVPSDDGLGSWQVPAVEPLCRSCIRILRTFAGGVGPMSAGRPGRSAA
jgi:hypothetical protein